MKARVANIERSYEAIKAKCAIIEDERSRLEESNRRLSEEVSKNKGLRSKAEKEVMQMNETINNMVK